jgi:hypothetical protein
MALGSLIEKMNLSLRLFYGSMHGGAASKAQSPDCRAHRLMSMPGLDVEPFWNFALFLSWAFLVG